MNFPSAQYAFYRIFSKSSLNDDFTFVLPGTKLLSNFVQFETYNMLLVFLRNLSVVPQMGTREYAIRVYEIFRSKFPDIDWYASFLKIAIFVPLNIQIYSPCFYIYIYKVGLKIVLFEYHRTLCRDVISADYSRVFSSRQHGCKDMRMLYPFSHWKKWKNTTIIIDDTVEVCSFV